MKFIREIGIKNLSDKLLNNLEQEGFTLIWKDDSVEVWVERQAVRRY